MIIPMPSLYPADKLFKNRESSVTGGRGRLCGVHVWWSEVQVDQQLLLQEGESLRPALIIGVKASTQVENSLRHANASTPISAISPLATISSLSRLSAGALIPSCRMSDFFCLDVSERSLTHSLMVGGDSGFSGSFILVLLSG